MGQGQSTKKVATPATRQPTFVTKGTIRVCPHKNIRCWETLSWRAESVMESQNQPLSTLAMRHVYVPWQCTECVRTRNYIPFHGDRDHLPPAPSKVGGIPFGARQPKIELETGGLVDGSPRIIKSWRVPVFQCGSATSNVLLTSDFINSALEIANLQYPHLVCHHSTFTDDAFLGALKAEADVVHTSPSGTELLDVRLSQWTQEPDKAAVASCPRCSAEYRWVRRGSHFLIEGRHDVSSYCLPAGSDSVKTAFISVSNPDSCHPRDEHLKIMACILGLGHEDGATHVVDSLAEEGDILPRLARTRKGSWETDTTL